jgi:hypothetical protein
MSAEAPELSVSKQYHVVQTKDEANDSRKAA